MAREPEQHLIVFLPFLRLETVYQVAGITFLPLRDSTGAVSAGLETAAGSLDRILSGYVDRRGSPLDNCVVATTSARGWDLSTENLPRVMWASSLLFLSSWALNEYYPRFSRRYVNSSNFRVVGQAFQGAAPRYLAVSARRRDGSTMDGGYRHGEFKFSLPPQCSIRDNAEVDADFLKGLDAACGAGPAVIDRLRTALPFVELANTDDDFMNERAEAILMGSAFEQLLKGDASAYVLGKRFGKLFGQFGGVRVSEARTVRPGIDIDVSKPEIAAAQPKWWVHRKWIEELYDVRSKVVHKGEEGSRSWGWEIAEHLVMAAHVFPLATKLLLANSGFYVLTDSDRGACLGVDQLLAETQWVEDEDGHQSDRSWCEITARTKREVRLKRAVDNYLQKNPSAFDSDGE